MNEEKKEFVFLLLTEKMRHKNMFYNKTTKNKIKYRVKDIDGFF